MKKYFALAAMVAASLAVRGQDTDAATLIQSAERAVRSGQYAEADLLYAKAAALGDRPETIPALWYLGTRAAGQGNPLAAEGFLERILKVDAKGPMASRALSGLGNLRHANPPEAESLFKQALALTQPGTREGQEAARGYSFLMLRQGRVEEAKALEDAWTRGVQVSQPLKRVDMPAGVYSVGGGVSAPKLLSKVEPQYTEEARTAHLMGTVVLSVDIDPQGTATNIEVAQSVEPGLDQKAMEAVRQWQFRPGAKDGTPVTVRATIEVNFRLK